MKTLTFLLRRRTYSYSIALFLSAFSLVALAGNAQAQQLLNGDTIGIDFQPTAEDAAPTILQIGTNFNVFDIQTENGETGTLTAGTLINTSGAAVSGVGFSLTNNTGQNTTRAVFSTQGAEGSQVPGSLLAEMAVWDDGYISNNQGAAPLDEGGHFFLTFTGLDDSLSYNLEGGFDNQDADGGNLNFDAMWSADGQSFTTMPKGGTGYGVLNGLRTDGAGNLDITVARNTLHVTVAGLTLTAVPEPSTIALVGLGTLGVLALRRRR